MNKEFEELGFAQYSPDNKTRAFRARDPEGKETVVVNGEPWRTRFLKVVSEPIISPTGERVAIAVKVKDEPPGETIVVNDQPWPEMYKRVGKPKFDSQSKHVAAITQSPKTYNETVVVNGIPWKKEFDEIEESSLIFSPDGKKVAAIARTKVQPPRFTAVVNGIPWEKVFPMVKKLIFGPGNRLAAEVQVKEKPFRSYTIAIDGKPWKKDFGETEKITFSADGRDVAAVSRYIEGDTVVINGQEIEEAYEKVSDVQFTPDGNLKIRAKSGGQWQEFVKQVPQRQGKY